jgi:hypothetical protein
METFARRKEKLIRIRPKTGVCKICKKKRILHISKVWQLNDEEVKADTCAECLQPIREFILRMAKNGVLRTDIEKQSIKSTIIPKEIKEYYDSHFDGVSAYMSLLTDAAFDAIPKPRFPNQEMEIPIVPKRRLVWGFYSIEYAIMKQTVTFTGHPEESEWTEIVKRAIREIVFKTPF